MTTVDDQGAASRAVEVEGNGERLVETMSDTATPQSRRGKDEGSNMADVRLSPRSNRPNRVDIYRRKRRRHKKTCTIQEVRAEAAHILEEFLQYQLAQKNIQVESPDRRPRKPEHGSHRPNRRLQSRDHEIQSPDNGYQRYVELNIRTETSPSGDSSTSPTSGTVPKLPVVYQAQDSIPYADDDENDQKADSLPSDYRELFLGGSNISELEIHHGHSKSDPPCTLYDVSVDKPYRPKQARVPPPPPPPGTPYTESEGSSEKVVSVPYTYDRSSTMSTDNSKSLPQSSDSLSVSTDLGSRKQTSPKKRRKPPDTLDIDTYTYSNGDRDTYSEGDFRDRSSSSPTKSSILSRLMRMKKSSTSSSESEAEPDSATHGKKKKSMFKKAQKRISVLFKMKKGRSSPDDEQSETFTTRQKDLKKKQKKKKNKSDKGNDEADMSPRGVTGSVVEEKHTHTDQHIRQHHTGVDGRMILRTEDSTEIVDIVTQRETKHIEKDWKVKESADTKTGLIGRVRRMTSRDKGNKKIKGSRSAHEKLAEAKNDEVHPKSYSRNISVPGSHAGRLHEAGFAGADDSSSHRLNVDLDGYNYIQTQRQVDRNREDISVTQVVSQNDIRRHSSSIDIVDHAGAMVQRFYFETDDNLPRNKSFALDRETCVHEKRIVEDGRIKTVRDVDTHDHIYISEDSNIETDGESGSIEAVPFRDLSASKKEELYEKIAEKLAAMGDSLNTRQEESREESTSSSPAQKDPDVMEKTQLSSLEMELCDGLSAMAADVDAKVPLAANARRAASTIMGQLVFNQITSTVGDTMNQQVGWQQLAGLFNWTKKAVSLAGAGGALAVKIKEQSLQCVEDKFAKWIVGQGGWETMLSDDSDSDSDID